MNIPDGPLRDQLEFADTDVLLRDDVRRLGTLVGEVLAEQGSPSLLAEVESIRRAAIARREQGLPVDALAGEMGRVPVADAELVVRAFSTYFGAINLAERVHRIRRRRDYERITELPQPGGLRATTQRTVIRRLVEASRGDLVARRYLHVGRQRESWRISARVQGKGDVHYGVFLERLRQHVEPVLEPYRRQDGSIAVTYTGITPVVYQVQEELLNDLYYSFLTALILVTAIMTVPLGSLRAGLVAMLPNALPMVVLFGGMGWIRFPVDIGTVMTASVALGLAVDGTFHFLTWFRDEFGRSRSRSLAVEMAFRHCGRALVQTAIICSLGLLVFGLSGFLPARNFSWMLMVLLLGSLASNLVLLPAILLSPLGSWFLRPGPMVRHASGRADDSRPTGRHATSAAGPRTL